MSNRVGQSRGSHELPYILGPPCLTREPGGTTLTARVGPDGDVSASNGPSPTGILAPTAMIGPAARFTSLAGVGVTSAKSLLAAWSARTAAPGSQKRTIGSVLRLAADTAFPASVDALRVPILVGDPTLALSVAGRGVVAYSQGPRASATVRASALSVP